MISCLPFLSGRTRALFCRAAVGVAAITGCVIADGIVGPGLDVAAARAVLALFKPSPLLQPLKEEYNAYGCNMAVRLAPIREHALRFDENLPLYGWLEDVDFCRQLTPYGRIVKKLADDWRSISATNTVALRGSALAIHRSPIPSILWRKGTFPSRSRLAPNGSQSIGQFRQADSTRALGRPMGPRARQCACVFGSRSWTAASHANSRSRLNANSSIRRVQGNKRCFPLWRVEESAVVAARRAAGEKREPSTFFALNQ